MERLQVNLNHHPATTVAALRPTRNQKDRQIVSEFNMDVLADGIVDADTAQMVVNWWTHPPGYDDQFKFHYIESTGYDCGWHRQPHENEPEIPFDHFQQRASPEDDYQYQSVDFQEDNPIGLMWEVTTTRLEQLLYSRWDPVSEI